ncbi:MAG: helix-turn-helix domain-containing protein [Candidatus Woesearchaeota archaeon]
MVVNERFLKKLKDFGLNSYEAKIWAALLSRGVSTAGELSDIANVPRSRSYDVLESLEKKGFIMMKVGKPIKYLAIQPNEVLERVKKRIKEDSETHIQMMDEIKGSEVLTELSILHSQGIEMINPSDMAGSIKGRDSLTDHLEYMINEAKHSIILVTSEEGIVKKSEQLMLSFKKAKDRGVSIRISAPLTAKTKRAIESLKAVAEVRTQKDQKARFCIVDDKQVAFMFLHDENVHPSYDAGIWATTPSFGQALKSMFETTWDNMKATS